MVLYFFQTVRLLTSPSDTARNMADTFFFFFLFPELLKVYLLFDRCSNMSVCRHRSVTQNVVIFVGKSGDSFKACLVVWSLIPTLSIHCVTSCHYEKEQPHHGALQSQTLFKDMLIHSIKHSLYAQCAVQLLINLIPLQFDPYEPVHLIESP